MASSAFGRLVAGPIGSGKTTACVVELLRRSIEQERAKDGLSYTRFAVVRQTLKQLKDTVLKDCTSWLGGMGHWKVSDNTFHLDFDHVRSEWIFIPLENSEDQARLLSMQLTGAWASECIEMDIGVVAPISGRLGRYPSGERGVPTWHGMIADTNMPTELTPWHQFMTDPPKDWQVFTQPSGLSPAAENLNYLAQTAETIKLPIDHPVRIAQGRKYYDRLVGMYGEESNWIRRYVKAEFGDDPSGLAVYRESFKASFHVVDSTMVIPGYSILVGQDFGRNPWSLICQVDHMGRLLVHEEVSAENIGLEKHVNESLRPRLLSEQYLGAKVAVVGDPSGVAKGNVSEESNFDALKRLGFPCFPAVTNDIDPRLRAVETFFGRQVNGGPAIMINGPKCPMLVRGLAGGYRFVRTMGGALKAIPDKTDHVVNGKAINFSHVQDCLQYAALVAGGGMMEVIARQLRGKQSKKRPPVSAAGWT